MSLYLKVQMWCLLIGIFARAACLAWGPYPRPQKAVSRAADVLYLAVGLAVLWWTVSLM